jgi:hypothetical protein
MALHTLHDGSELHLASAKELAEVPVWKGNRIIDEAHVTQIERSIDGDIKKLDGPYRIVIIPEVDGAGAVRNTRYLVDGQHRRQVIANHFKTHLCEEDFPVLVILKEVESEEDIIAYFNTLNNVKPLHWKTDPHLIVNTYIAALEAEFNRGKAKMLRAGTTCRPYLGVDKLRESLTKIVRRLSTDKGLIAAFVREVRAWNDHTAQEIRRMEAVGADLDAKQTKAANHNFMLAYDTEHRWILHCLDKLSSSA